MGELLTDYLHKDHRVTGRKCAQLIQKLHDAIKGKECGLLKAGLGLLHNYAPYLIQIQLQCLPSMPPASNRLVTHPTLLIWLHMISICWHT